MGLFLSCATALSSTALSSTSSATAQSSARARLSPGRVHREVGGARRGDGSTDDGSPVLRAVMTCDRAEAPGRVRCEVEARVATQESIAWGDVVIVRTPPFAAALRGRIGPHDATTREVTTWRWALAVVAREAGRGDIEARVRLVVCRDGHCSPRQVTVSGRVVVGD